MAKQTLSPEQASSLLDILIHHETYTEIEDFKYDRAIHEYGPPFQQDSSIKPATPILQTLLIRLGLQLPGLKDVSENFWSSRIQPLLSALSSANLSESYDKGVLGQRKTVATAISALLEYPARGYFGGFSKQKPQKADNKYDPSDPEDISKAWVDFRQQMVYGELIDELFSRTAETDQLKEHSQLVQGAHRFVILNLASIMHYTLIVSPKGPSLLSLLESAHRLVPYLLIRQTLKVSNAATMINGMVKIGLAKASVGTVTNWLGLSVGADEGMNLMQTIISTVLGWDISKLKKRVSHIESDKQGPTKEQRSSLAAYVNLSQLEQEQRRSQSKSQNQSIVAIILASTSLTAKTHSLALEYLSLKLSIRDREQLIEIFCRRNPDLVTPTTRDLISAYDHIIRGVHNAVDLSGTVSDAQAFLDDLIKLSKPNSSRTGQVPVEDYVKLLESHQQSSHRFMHQVCKNGEDLVVLYKDFGHKLAAQFRESNARPATVEKLERLLDDLSTTDRDAVIQEVDKHVEYLNHLSESSSSRIRATLNRDSKTTYGPGVYLARWQALLDDTLITPTEVEGQVRKAGSEETKEASRTDVDGEKKGDSSAVKTVEQEHVKPPEVGTTVKLLMSHFWEMLREWTKDG